MQWDADMIVDWILSLDEAYRQYENVLRNALNEEGVDGSMLRDLDRNDLRGWGVTNLKHRIGIIREIKILTSQFYQQQIGSSAYQPHSFQNDNGDGTGYI